MRFIIVAVLILWPIYCLAQDGNHGQGHDAWHSSFYEKLVSPKTKVSCCNLNDCRPTESRSSGDHYEVKVDGKWVAVPPDIIIHIMAPDWGAHVCAPASFNGDPKTIFCVVLPPEM